MSIPPLFPQPPPWPIPPPTPIHPPYLPGPVIPTSPAINSRVEYLENLVQKLIAENKNMTTKDAEDNSEFQSLENGTTGNVRMDKEAPAVQSILTIQDGSPETNSEIATDGSLANNGEVKEDDNLGASPEVPTGAKHNLDIRKEKQKPKQSEGWVSQTLE